jgi:hypothetical protein
MATQEINDAVDKIIVLFRRPKSDKEMRKILVKLLEDVSRGGAKNPTKKTTSTRKRKTTTITPKGVEIINPRKE